MKKIILLMAMVFTLLLSSCQSAETLSDKTTITTTSFYQYDFIKNILGDNIDDFNLILLNERGLDTHSYSPNTKDIVLITESDLFVYNGGISEYWVEDILNSPENENLNSLNMMDYVEVKDVEIKEGMQEDEDHAEEGNDTETHIGEQDEHIWMSLKNAITLVDVLKEEIIKLDPNNATTYSDNAANYIVELTTLDKEYQNVIDSANNNLIVVADRFPFRYLVDDYGIDYYAAFEGCSSESSASFQTVIFLSEMVDENNLDTVIVTETGTSDVANSVIDATSSKNQDILILNAMQTISKEDIDNGVNYLDIMTQNLDVLAQALN